jgi:hypothetical protein
MKEIEYEGHLYQMIPEAGMSRSLEMIAGGLPSNMGAIVPPPKAVNIQETSDCNQ